jgi:hypothetical protein
MKTGVLWMVGQGHPLVRLLHFTNEKMEPRQTICFPQATDYMFSSLFFNSLVLGYLLLFVCVCFLCTHFQLIPAGQLST